MAMLDQIITQQQPPGQQQQQGQGGMFGNLSMDDIMATYNMLASLSPLITMAATGGFDSDKPGGPSIMQKLLVQSMQHPGQPIQASTQELMNPNILGIRQPKQMSPAVPATMAGISALPSILKGIGGLSNIIFGQGQGVGQGPLGAAAPSPVVGAGELPQSQFSDMPFDVTIDPVVETPVDMSPADLEALISSGYIDPSEFGFEGF